MRESVAADEISLSDLLNIFWSYRAVMLVASVFACTVLLGGLLFVYMATPNQQSASLPYRVLFEGADKGEYPNGLNYSPADVISTTILESVYERNQLEGYLTFDEFKGAIFVYEGNAALTLLDKQYQQKLSNTKLSAVDRQIIELEYHEKRQSLRNGSYEIHFLHSGGLFELPETLIDKVLKDILSTWATVADEQKGVFKYRIPLYTRNILPPDLLETQDYIVSIDIFNNKIDKIFENIELLEKLPGAQVTRVTAGQIGLAEISSNLLDTRQFKLEPLVGLVRSAGLSKNPALASLYLENQMFQLKLDQQESQEKIKVLESSLNFYLEKNQRPTTPSGEGTSQSADIGNGQLATTYIPQFGDSFLDRVVEMSTQGNDAEFRQEIAGRIVEQGLKVAAIEKKVQYYKSLIEAMNKAVSGNAEFEEIILLIKTRFAEIEGDIVTALDNMNAIYQLISKNNLRPETELYSITDPLSVEAHRSFMGKKVMLGGVLFLLLSALFTVLGCFAHYSLKNGRKESV